ncbi:uncharacterized protein K489DRAFT_116252 [Dissoconium aciculare CBS 342.82]|uniref:Uncharacterized protein n=1 Tax=Dissoconium aciculare CBS 342.82 TaxID=1314786 RepID=A0A6J3MFL6_9PEZI|nr:uncharacterized protein K489DRAFT_116252 [Dissoconium aciculare CBS 342.82]KAF1826449.1 hypothetical protein K489DRAFT_116252 [Dissoconium aciculare CBS 342.82]
MVIPRRVHNDALSHYRHTPSGALASTNATMFHPHVDSIHFSSCIGLYLLLFCRSLYVRGRRQRSCRASRNGNADHFDGPTRCVAATQKLWT